MLECPNLDLKKDLEKFNKEIHKYLRPSDDYNLYISDAPGEYLITDGRYGKKDDDQYSNTITSEGNLKANKAYKSKSKSKKNSSGIQSEGNKNEKKLLEALEKVRTFKVTLIF